MADVIAGIRPEAFGDSAIDGEHAGRARFTTRIDVVEAMGPEVYAYFDVPCRSELPADLLDTVERRDGSVLGGRDGVRQMVARLPVATGVAAGEEATLTFDPGGLNLFDPHTGANLLAPAPDPGGSKNGVDPAARALTQDPLRRRRRALRSRRAMTQASGDVHGEIAETGRHDEVVHRLAELRVLPLATLDAGIAEDVGHALVRGGLPCLEITFRAVGAAEAIGRARRVDGLLVGAGTVLTPEQAHAAADAGAAFAVAPGLNEEVVDCCRELGLPFFPGVATPTEIDRARRLGLRTLKAFPISTLGGVSFLRAVSATYPDVRFIPTGGVDDSTLREYLALPNVLACGGSWITSGQILRERAFDELTRRARQAVELAA